MSGVMRRQFLDWRMEVISCLAHIEAVIDFGEDESNSVNETKILSGVAQRITALKQSISYHLNDARRGERIRSGISVAIVGPPNAGKSTLLNALAQRDVAIVSSIPGTTRDVLEVALNLNGLPVVVADTAGIRESEATDVIEREGMKRARDRMAAADLRIAVFDAQQTLNSPPPAQISDAASLVDAQTIVVFNKADLLTRDRSATATAAGASVNDLLPASIATLWQNTLQARARSLFSTAPAAMSLVSLAPSQGAATASASPVAASSLSGPQPIGFGLSALLSTLTQHINERLLKPESSTADSSGAAVLITRERHRQHLQTCLSLLQSYESK